MAESGWQKAWVLPHQPELWFPCGGAGMGTAGDVTVTTSSGHMQTQRSRVKDTKTLGSLCPRGGIGTECLLLLLSKLLQGAHI